jgi:hypothetical protein
MIILARQLKSEPPEKCISALGITEDPEAWMMTSTLIELSFDSCSQQNGQSMY